MHYRTRVLCRVSQTLGKGRITLGNFFAECSTRRSAHGYSSTGEAGFAECLFSGTRQIFAVCQAALGKKKVETGRTTANWRTERANGTNWTAERDGVENFAECQTRGTRQRFKLRRVPSWQHSAKFRALPSAATLALGEVWLFAECHAYGTRQSFKLRRVPK